MQYTYEQRLEFGFDEHSTKSDVLNAIKRVGYWSGGTSTGAAIHYALEQLFKKSKPNKRKLMVLPVSVLLPSFSAILFTADLVFCTQLWKQFTSRSCAPHPYS